MLGRALGGRPAKDIHKGKKAKEEDGCNLPTVLRKTSCMIKQI